MNEAERVFAIKETARKIVDAMHGERLAFVHLEHLDAIERNAHAGNGSNCVALAVALRETDFAVERIIEFILESML